MPHPLVDAGARASLCFHDIADDSPVVYTRPMAYLLAVADGLREQGISDRIRIYFDDGYASVLDAVRELRARYPELEIVVAITLSFVGEPGRVSWSDVNALHEQGVVISAHGREHLHMEQLTEAQMLVQFSESRTALLRYGSNEFVLPYGTYSEAVLAVNARNGLFSVVTSVDYGWDHGQSLRPRLMVTSELTVPDVIARLASPE